MKHFHRTQLPLDEVLNIADGYFSTLGMTSTARDLYSRGFSGELGNLKLLVKAEGGHYTFVEAQTDQIGESRLDRNVKKFFVRLHRALDPRHVPEAAY
ncbi:MAG TPA: hypothetical protein VKZ41_13970 [Gemmatimonadales bacterium]|nr:hypothetical protein [Gemmatimonadales bacterium]